MRSSPCSLLLSLLLAAAATASAQDSSAISPLVPLRNSSAGVDPTLGVAIGQALEIAIDDLPQPQRESMRKQRQDMERLGHAQVSDAMIADSLQQLRQAALVASPASPSSIQLSEISGSELAGYRLLGTISAPTEPQRRVCTAKRVFERPDHIVVALEESRYACSDGGALIVREFANVRVGTALGFLTVNKSNSGLSLSTLEWSSHGNAYTLSVYDDVDQPSEPAYTRAWLLRLASGLHP